MFICFVSLVNIETGRAWTIAKRVSSINNITDEEFKEITGSHEFINTNL